MITIQYEPDKNLFRVETESPFGLESIVYWRSLGWLQTTFAHCGFPYDWQAVMNNPQKKFLI